MFKVDGSESRQHVSPRAHRKKKEYIDSPLRLKMKIKERTTKKTPKPTKTKNTTFQRNPLGKRCHTLPKRNDLNVTWFTTWMLHNCTEMLMLLTCHNVVILALLLARVHMLDIYCRQTLSIWLKWRENMLRSSCTVTMTDSINVQRCLIRYFQYKRCQMKNFSIQLHSTGPIDGVYTRTQQCAPHWVASVSGAFFGLCIVTWNAFFFFLRTFTLKIKLTVLYFRGIK